MPTLPNGMIPIAGPYSSDDPGGVMRTDVAGGAARYGLDWDRGRQRYTVTLILDSAEFSVWNAFYWHIIKKGAITFDMPLDSGFGVTAHAVNIMPGSYAMTRESDVLIVVSFIVEAENKVYEFTPLDAQNMIDLHNEYGGQFGKTLARIEQFALYDTQVLP
jgi:hypothetical protein